MKQIKLYAFLLLGLSIVKLQAAQEAESQYLQISFSNDKINRFEVFVDSTTPSVDAVLGMLQCLKENKKVEGLENIQLKNVQLDDDNIEELKKVLTNDFGTVSIKNKKKSFVAVIRLDRFFKKEMLQEVFPDAKKNLSRRINRR